MPVIGIAVGWDDVTDAGVGEARRAVDPGADIVEVDQAVGEVVPAHPATATVAARIADPNLVLHAAVDMGEACSVHVSNV